jgi:hypothetical protein
MKNLLLLTICCLFACKSQQRTLRIAYKQSITELNPFFQEIYKEWDNHPDPYSTGGLAIFTKDKTVFLENNNNYTNMEFNPVDTITQNIWLSGSVLEANSLIISIGVPFGNQFIKHKITNGAIESEFEEYYKSDKAIKLNPTDDPTNQMNIPLVKSKVSVSKTSNFQVGDVIYGKAELVTKPYYLIPVGSGTSFDRIYREYVYHLKITVRSE